MTYYKVLNADGTPYHGGYGRWPLPANGQPGAWTPRIPDPLPCVRGYHLCRDMADLLVWLGPAIWVAEADGVIVIDGDKVAVESARLIRRLPWDDNAARLFAADCAERALPIFERERPGDERPRRSIEATRAYARGEIDGEMLAAAGAAAGDAAWDAATVAAWDAARAAARAAAWAAGAAAWDAATVAARAAARAAAWDAGAAAGAAAWDAAWDAARAAEDAERDWQQRKLAEYLGLATGGDQ